jgi:hypothetical protein
LVGVLSAHEEILLTSNDDLEVGDEVRWELSTLELLKVCKDGSKVGWGHVFSGINSEPRETNAKEIIHVISDSGSNVGLFGVEISEVNEPAIVEDEGVGPGVEGSLAVEVKRTIWNGWELHTWSATGVGPVSPCEALAKEGRTSRAILLAPVVA